MAEDAFSRLSHLPPKGHTGLLGIVHAAHGRDWAELICPFQPWFLLHAEKGLTASGPIYSLVDAAAGAAIIARTNDWRPMATLDLRIDHLRFPDADEPLHAHAICHHLTRQVAFVRCDVHQGDPNRRIAFGVATFYFMPVA